MNPELILHNGRIYTVDPAHPWAEAVAVTAGRFVAVGSNKKILSLAGPATEKHNLAGRLALPGLIDSHIHLYDWSLSRRQAPLADCRSKAEMMAIIEERAGSLPPGRWLSGRGWNERNWDSPDLPTRSDLDAVTGDHPALFWRVDMHAAVANSAALLLAGIGEGTRDPEGGVIGRGPANQHEETASTLPNGLLWELAINLVSRHIPKPEPVELDEGLVEAIAVLNSLGITSAHDQRMKDCDEGPPALAAYQRLEHSGRLNLRINCNLAAHDLPHLIALGLRSGFGSDLLRLGHLKLFADGSLGSQTAWLLSAYAGTHHEGSDYLGVSVTPPEQMAAEIRQASEAGFAASVHAIGDRANRVVLDIFEEVASAGNRLPIPHRIEHVQIVDPADASRLAENNITASVQPIHALDDMDMVDRVLGERSNRAYIFGRLARSGARLALGSDAPVADPNPFLGFQGAICRQRPERMERGPWNSAEKLTLEETIFGYTMGAAQAAGWQNSVGSISPDKRADLIVLDRDLFEIVAQGITGRELADTRVEMTLFDGRIVYKRGA
jgi:predicted amidohydrolase YtcJ